MLARYLMLSSAIMGFLLPAIPALARDVTLNQSSSNQSSSAEGPKKSPDFLRKKSQTCVEAVLLTAQSLIFGNGEPMTWVVSTRSATSSL